MRNKLKRRQKCEDASCKSEEQQRASETSPAATDTCSNHVAAADISTRKPPQQQEKTSDIKVAPIFLTQHSKSKRISDVKLRHESVLPDVQLVKSQQHHVSVVSEQTKRRSCRRKQLSASDLHICLEEIQTSNPGFPVRTVFSTLQKKASERLQEFGCTADNLTSLQNHLTEKRKRENETCERLPKRLRTSPTAEGAVGMGHCHVSAQGVQESPDLVVKRQSRSNKLSRSYRLRQQSVSTAGPVNSCESASGLMNHKESHSQSLKTSDVFHRDFSFEDVLWTDKYSPQHSSEVVGNSASVNKLQSWLKKWKLRADCDERRKMEEERKQQENSNDSWDCGDFQGEAGAECDRDEPLCNTMLITGPPGVGKTASVYACAQELGFKVFEVNCSSQRNGRHVLSQLKEATQSHLVETSGKDPLKPAYFNNYNISICTPKSETLPGKAARPKTVTSTSRKRAAQNSKGKVNSPAVNLTNYFKLKAKADQLHFGGLSPSEKPDSKKSDNPSPGCDQTVPQNKKTATSLILFEEVEVIFDDDVGFLTAIKTFMMTTKRPVILTTNDPSFKERFSCSLEEIVFKTPSVVNVCSYLQLLGLAENVRLELDDVRSLLQLSGGDVRRCLLQLQLWVHSGGGRASLSRGSSEESNSGLTEKEADVDSQLPHCDPGCTATMLGLHHVTQNQLPNLLKCPFWSETDMNELLRLLAESWRRGVPLLYSNLELLLPVGDTSVHVLDKETCSGLQRELTPSDKVLHIQHSDGNTSPKVSATSSNPVRNISRLSRRKHITEKQNPQRTSSKTDTCLRDMTKQNAAEVAADCLDALTDFFDLMSDLDATMPAVSGSHRPEGFIWTGAEIKDGLLDEMREEEEEAWSWSQQERLLDIQAAVEGLGCHRCFLRVCEARTEAQKYRQEPGGVTLPASSKRQSFSFSHQPLCSPSVSHRRLELSRSVLCRKSYSLLGNRRAVSVDYMPFLRFICRCQRAQQQKEEPDRWLNYFNSSSNTHLGLSRSTIQLLAEDFS